MHYLDVVFIISQIKETLYKLRLYLDTSMLKKITAMTRQMTQRIRNRDDGVKRCVGQRFDGSLVEYLGGDLCRRKTGGGALVYALISFSFSRRGDVCGYLTRLDDATACTRNEKRDLPTTVCRYNDNALLVEVIPHTKSEIQTGYFVFVAWEPTPNSPSCTRKRVYL